MHDALKHSGDRKRNVAEMDAAKVWKRQTGSESGMGAKITYGVSVRDSKFGKPAGKGAMKDTVCPYDVLVHANGKEYCV
ncbi:hypothetical protein CAFE_23390 [Caprobacter fermentans]|uniref:Uncharacterized protein n=1 Tax=Caproicibacter fermentans TaxID=2576756 RepID=A0A7G8TD97_9FIRM|nr:hypothetical protein [Caproicibacter fermentans]OCN00380.1 hypothetical protein A7X67_07755 [Clostridium sp. W14A]MVB11618.1 hypothetical protein [Caproicibacter fermentans]QNK39531.1 hypothetical protein HCR03_12355 [Caproicibacter fermentans]QNK40119.1 hypothetical protein HCR03_15715 [Caproicibacter fermentans]QNK41588.1 hypothetical protein HCR03_04830 [Caproicibacter fermentans]